MNVSRDIPYRNERTDMTQNQQAAEASNSSYSEPEGGNTVRQTAKINKNRCIELDPTFTLPASKEPLVPTIPRILIFLLLLHMFYFYPFLSAP